MAVAAKRFQRVIHIGKTAIFCRIFPACQQHKKSHRFSAGGKPGQIAPFAFHITEEGLPEECEMPNEREEQLPEENICVQLMRENYPNGVERKALTTKIVDVENINRALARVKITRAIAKGLLMERGGVLYLP